MARSKTDFRHIEKSGQVTRVTSEGGNFYVGNTDQRAEGKMSHYRSIDYNGTSKPAEESDFDDDDWD